MTYDQDSIERIVVRMPNWVGDVVMATPALRAIRQHWPDAELTVLCLPSGEAILRGSPHIDRFEIYDRQGKDLGLLGMRRLIRRLRGSDFHLGICLPNSFSSAWILKRARVRRRLGTDYGKRGWLLTDRFRPEMDGHRRVPKPMVEHYGDLIESIGVPPGSPDLELFETEEGRRRAEIALHLHGINPGDKVVAINPGASFGLSKLWLPERFAEVADRLQENHGLKPLLIGGPGEESILDAIEKKMKTSACSTSDDVVNLDALKSLVSLCGLMVTTDTGPRHFAVAMGVPVVVVMGPTDPRYTASGLERSTVVRIEDLECSPCHLKACPITHHGCMEWIEAGQVYAACEELLERFPPPVLASEEEDSDDAQTEE